MGHEVSCSGDPRIRRHTWPEWRGRGYLPPSGGTDSSCWWETERTLNRLQSRWGRRSSIMHVIFHLLFLLPFIKVFLRCYSHEDISVILSGFVTSLWVEFERIFCFLLACCYLGDVHPYRKCLFDSFTKCWVGVVVYRGGQLISESTLTHWGTVGYRECTFWGLCSFFNLFFSFFYVVFFIFFFPSFSFPYLCFIF